VARKREPIVGVRLGRIQDLPVRDLLIRFVFGAAISAAAGITSVIAGAEPGGILLAFPAILPATLTLIEKEEDERQAEDLDVGSILGATALAAFAVVVWKYIDGGSAPVVLLTATAAWLATAVLLYLGLRVVFVRRSARRTIGG
jgi:uncharacterized membrane protein (GlpM family)